MEAFELTPEQPNICMQHVKRTFEDKVAEELRRCLGMRWRQQNTEGPFSCTMQTNGWAVTRS
jgi:hypothetical protein